MFLAFFRVVLDVEVEAVDYYVTKGSFRFVICFGIRGCGRGRGRGGVLEAAVGFPEGGGNVFCACVGGDGPVMAVTAETYEDLDACICAEGCKLVNAVSCWELSEQHHENEAYAQATL